MEILKADAATSPEAARLERLLTSVETRLRAAFQEFIRQSTSEEMMAAVADLIERGDVDGALALIQPFIRAFGNILPGLFQDVATQEVDSHRGHIRATTGISFDPGMPRAAALMRTAQLEFIQGLTDQQVVAIRAAIAVGLEQGSGYQAIARSFRASIGLAPAQVAAVAHYRRLLQAGDRRALDRQLRDKRFDPSVENAIEDGEPIDPGRIDRMVEAYRRRSLNLRASTIARTEGLAVLSAAQDEAMRQTMEQAEISAEEVEQQWHTIIDGRERDTHHGMNGQKQIYGQPFVSPSGAKLRYPGDRQAPAAEVVRCRCRRTFRIRLNSLRGVSLQT